MVNRFYPSPANVTYYIGNVLIDDIFRVDFQRTVKHQPIWGYDSRKYDFVAKGKEIVMGNIVINYRYPGYLKAAIDNAAAINESTRVVTANNFQGAQNVVDDPAFVHSISSLAVEDRANAIANQLLLASQPKPEEFKTARSKNNSLISILKDNLTKTYGSDPEDEEKHNLRSPLDDDIVTTFDLSIRYGFQDSQGGYTRTIQGCVLIGESETVSASAGVSDDMSSSAQPILEVYSFFARDIKVA